MQMIELSQLLPTIQMYVSEVTDTQLSRVAKKTGKVKKGDIAITTLKSDLAKRLWVVMDVLDIKSKDAGLKAKAATDDEAEARLKNEEAQLGILGKIARDIFWYEVLDEIGDWTGSYGIRDDWGIVKNAAENGPPEFLRKLLGLPDANEE